MRCLRFLLAAAAALAVSRDGRAAPAADVVVVWTPGADPAPIAAVARELGAAVIDRTPRRAVAIALAPLVQAGIDAHDALAFDAAWAALERARDEVDRAGAAGLTAAQLSDLFLYRALVRTQRQDGAAAWDELIAAAAVDPARVLDAARFPPKVIEELARARAQVLAGPRGTLAVEAPAGCAITVDGRPAAPELPHVVGPHWVAVHCPDHLPWGARVDVVEGAMRIAARVVPFAAPSDAEVLIQARAAAARAVIVAELRGGVGVARLIGADGRERDRRSVAISGDLAPLAAAVRALARPALTAAPRRWYQSRWVWMAGGVLAAAAILVPVTAAVAGEPSDSATVRGPGSGFP